MENSRKSKSFEARLKSFRPNVLFDPWPSTKPTPESFARAGFYRKFSFTYKDVVRCDDCGLELDDWTAEDDPIAEHCQRSKDCPQIRLDVQRQMRLLAMEEADKQDQLAKQKAKDEAFSCRRCAAKFPSNSKLHKHVAERHTRKLSVLQSTVELAASKLPTAPLATPPASTPSTTPKLSYAAVAKSAKSTKASLPTPPASPHPKISYATLAESTSKSTSPPVPSHIKPKASTTPRNYMTMEDLFRRFSPTNTPTTNTPTKAAKPKKASPKKSGCEITKTPVLIELAKPRKVAPIKVANPTATSPPPSSYYQQAKHDFHIRPSGIISQHKAYATPVTHIWQYTRDLGLRLIKLSY